MTDREKILAEIESAIADGQRLMIASQGTIEEAAAEGGVKALSLIGDRIRNLPAAEEVVRWCVYCKNGEPFYVFDKDWDCPDAIKTEEYHRVAIRKIGE
jgi:hypothetical protein